MSEGGYRPGPGYRGSSAVRLVWVYPDLLSTYGDRGNLLVLARRARLRGFPVEIAEVNSDQQVPVDGDIYLLGGGEDLPQILAARRLAAAGGLAAAAARGAVIFAVCAGYQIVGTEFGGAEGEPVPGLGLLDIRSGRGERRGVGEIVADVDPALGAGRLTGFENHQGVTRRGPEAKPLATVVTGVGNGDGTEGAYAAGWSAPTCTGPPSSATRAWPTCCLAGSSRPVGERLQQRSDLLGLRLGQWLSRQRRAARRSVGGSQHGQGLRHTSILTDPDVCGKLGSRQDIDSYQYYGGSL